jgi:serine phosphatase RsbU (regulator of sigma subunit)
MEHTGRIRIIQGLTKREKLNRISFFLITFLVFIILVISVVLASRWFNKPFAGFLVNERMVFSNVGQYYWSGTRAGLQYPDKILKADGQPITSMKDLNRLLKNKPAGTPITYTIERKGKTKEIVVTTMLFGLKDLFFLYGIYVFVGIIYFILGVVVFILKPDTTVSWVFFMISLLFSLHYFSTFDVGTTHAGLIRVFLFVYVLIPAFVLHFSFIFPEQKLFVKKYPYIQLIPYMLSVLLIIPIEFFYPGPLFVAIYKSIPLYHLVCLISFLISILYSFFQKKSIIARQRAKVLFVGAALAFPVPIIITILKYFTEQPAGLKILANFLVFPILVFPFFIAYSIAKHNLFDVDVFIKRTVGYGIMTVIVGSIYFTIQLVTKRIITGSTLGDYAEIIIFALFVVFLFNPINRRVQSSVDKLFYRKKIDYKDTVLSVSNALTSVFKLDEIIGKIIHTLRKEMFIDRAGVILLDPQKECTATFIGDSPGSSGDSTALQCLQPDDPLVGLVTKEKKLITLYDIDEDPYYSAVKESCGQRFSELGVSVTLPLKYKEEVIGLLALGNKKSGHFYSREDIDILETLSNQGAIAIENAKLFEENLEKGRMEEELKIAHDLQVSMLPEKPPELEGFQIAASSIPAREVGGDFYDFIQIPANETENKLGIVVADVSGKAVSGALVMSATRSVFRVLSEASHSVRDVMIISNARLKYDIKKGMFVALLYAVLDPAQKTLILSSAGQTQPILCSSASPPVYIETEGDKFPLGIIKDCDYQETNVALKQGDTVLFYTDGIVEAMNEKEEMYGFDRFLASIEEGKNLEADTFMEKLLNDVSRFVGDNEQHDDLTVVVIKVK